MKLKPKHLAFLLLAVVGCKATPNESLFHACYAGDLQEVARAIESGADVNQKSDLDESTTPLLACVGTGNDDIVKLLVEHGAKVEIDGDGGKEVLTHVQGPKNVKIRNFLEEACRKEKSVSAKD